MPVLQHLPGKICFDSWFSQRLILCSMISQCLFRLKMLPCAAAHINSTVRGRRQARTWQGLGWAVRTCEEGACGTQQEPSKMKQSLSWRVGLVAEVEATRVQTSCFLKCFQGSFVSVGVFSQTTFNIFLPLVRIQPGEYGGEKASDHVTQHQKFPNQLDPSLFCLGSTPFWF